MKKVYVTITGTKYHHGKDFLEKGMEVTLVKEKDNEHDSEAIVVRLPGVGDIGHIANSPYTVLGESMSAGRLYDKIGDTATATILYNMATGVICEVKEEDLRWNKEKKKRKH